ncbi:MAG: SprT-like domain-containing protein [Bacilli bacterium]|nr:SprT-like domain-containing protein [Bacilli bacterium]
MEIVFNDISVNIEVERKRNKNMYFRFPDANTLLVTCPYLTSDKTIIKFIEKNYSSLNKMHLKTIKNEESDEYFCFKGKRYIRVFDDSYEKVSFDDEFVYAKDEKSLDKFIKKYTKEYFELEVDYIKGFFTEIPNFSLRIRKMTTRWGVCNRTDKIVTLNSELVKRTKEELDYVIVHELCHFYEGNHSKKFWEHVSRYIPNYKELRKTMKEAI